MNKALCLLSAISLLVLMLGCGEDSGSNEPPVIDTFAIPCMVKAGEKVEFQVTAHDPDGDALTYKWTIDGESISNHTSSIRWIVPGSKESVIVQVHVSDGINQPVIRTEVLTIGIGSSCGEEWEVIVIKTDKQQKLALFGMTEYLFPQMTFLVVKTRFQYVTTKAAFSINLAQVILVDVLVDGQVTMYSPYAVGTGAPIYIGPLQEDFEFKNEKGFKEGYTITLDLVYKIPASAVGLSLVFPGNPPIELDI